MPSRVIETFGKSALESLAAGVQVIGYRHGGLEQFIDPTLAIGPSPSDFSDLIQKILAGDGDTPLIPSLEKYSTQVRLAHVWSLLGNSRRTTLDLNAPQNKMNIPPRMLLVSDFITQTGGGIETFLHETKQLLENNGYEVELCGSSRSVSTL
jgi:hypothetical protein